MTFTKCCNLRYIGENHNPILNGVCRNCGAKHTCLYRLWRDDLGHYQYYGGGEEVVELTHRQAVIDYIEEYPANYRIDFINTATGLVRKDAMRLPKREVK